jgi:hypothetical protein
VIRGALVAAMLLLAAGPSAAQRIPEGGCVQRKLAIVTQGAKLMARCYAQAARQSTALDRGCLDRAATRLKTGLFRLDRIGCAPTQDVDAVVGLTADYVSSATSLIADPEMPSVATPATAAESTPGPTPVAP